MTPQRPWPPAHWGTPPPYDDECSLLLWTFTQMAEDDGRAGIVWEQAPRPPAPLSPAR